MAKMPPGGGNKPAQLTPEERANAKFYSKIVGGGATKTDQGTRSINAIRGLLSEYDTARKAGKLEALDEWREAAGSRMKGKALGTMMNVILLGRLNGPTTTNKRPARTRKPKTAAAA